jgi:hypothetical protein
MDQASRGRSALPRGCFPKLEAADAHTWPCGSWGVPGPSMWSRYEHRTEPMLPRRGFLGRLLAHMLVALALMLVSLSIGVLGYRVTEGMSWLDALVNASMILGGMGPVNQLQTDAGKFFASFYALFSGIVFLVMAGILVAPVAHRLLHRLHLEG